MAIGDIVETVEVKKILPRTVSLCEEVGFVWWVGFIFLTSSSTTRLYRYGSHEIIVLFSTSL